MKMRYVSLFAAAVLAAGAQLASAASVTFSSSGIFQSSGTNVVSVSDANGTVSFTFNGVTNSSVATDTPNRVLGQFVFSAIAATDDVNSLDLTPLLNNKQFTLDIQQTAPAAGSGTVTSTSTVVGTLQISKTQQNTYTINVNFGGGSAAVGVVPPMFKYRPDNFSITGVIETNNVAQGPITSTASAFLKGEVIAVPLPAAALSGMGLLGLLGAHQTLRRRAMK